MTEAATYRFHTPSVFAGNTGTIDSANCVIHGVALITGGLVAEGHDLHVDSETLTQLHALGMGKGKVPVNLDHGSGIMATCGYVNEFRLDGNKLRGDWHLLKSHSETPMMLERAATMPDCFGLSVAFKGKGVMVNGKNSARAEKLLSVDCVTRPAANEGLFSAKEPESVDRNKKGMADQDNQSQEPTLADVMGLLKNISQRQDKFESTQAEIVNHINSSQDANQQQEPELDRDTLLQLHNASDEQLAQIGLTRAEVNDAVQEYNASLGGDDTQGESYEDQGQGQEDGRFAGQNAEGPGVMSPSQGVGAAAAEAFNALHRDVIELKAKIKGTELRAAAEGEELQFAEINNKMTILATQRDKAIELAEGLVAENEALQMAVRTGTRPVRAGVNNGVRLFSANDNGELHMFQQKIQEVRLSAKCSEGEALVLVSRSNPELHADWLQSQQRR